MKTIYVVLIILAGAVLLFAACVVGASNTAVGYEETISQGRASISIQEKRQVDLVGKLVQVVEADSKFESSTQIAVIQARNSAKAGNIGSAMSVISAVAEQYPDLKASAAYTQLMTELSVSENLKAQYRLVYNDNIREYNRYLRTFPASFFLFVANYQRQYFDYLEFDKNETELPDQLFNQP